MDRRNILKSRNHSGSEFRIQGCPRLPGIIIIILLLVFPSFVPSSGKVFWNRFLTQGRSILDPTGSWQQIYNASLTINGGHASLSVHGCDDPLELVKARLKQDFGSSKKNCLIGNENSFWMLSTASNQISRLLALAMPESDKSLIIAIDQSPDEFSKSTAVPPESIFSGYSLLAGSRVETIIKNEETGAALETRIADTAPDIIIGEISAKLSGHGWKQVYPGFRRRAKSYGDSKQYFLIFRRGEALCTVMAGPALRENKSCVTILLKEKNEQ